MRFFNKKKSLFFVYMVSFSENNDSLEQLLKDSTCQSIYNDFVEIYKSASNDGTNKDAFFTEKKMYDLLKKYNQHYLVFYFLGKHYDENNLFKYALQSYQHCIEKYKFVDAYLNMGIILYKCGQTNEALQIFKNEPEIAKDLRVMNFICAVYYLTHDFHNAYASYKNILKNQLPLSSTTKSIYNNFGFACSALGKCKKALEFYDKGLNIHLPESYEDSKLNVQLLQNKLLTYDYMFDIPKDITNEYLKINQLLHTESNKIITDNDKTRKINVGFVSPDLRHHVCSFFIECVLHYFDRNLFNVYCYANVANEDDLSRKLASYAGIKWFNIFKLSTQQAVQLVKSHNIDILIDLAGHTNDNRLDIFAKKPCKIQMTYLGYPNTTGLTNMDYRITDKYADPVETTQFFTEKLIRLPRCFICHNPMFDVESVPIDLTKHKQITFGVMNKLHKYNEHTFKIWRDIIQSVPNSVLLIKKDTKAPMDIRLKYLKKIGLDESRIRISDHISGQGEYYKKYNEIDICLDTFPYSGTTTSCDTLWMGVPIVTLSIPNRHVSNVTCSFLQNMKFPELIAHSLDEYKNIAVELANNQDKIIYYKQNIRSRFKELMNQQLFAKEFDEMLKSVYDESCDVTHGEI